MTGKLGWGLRIWVAIIGFLLLAPTVVVIPMSFGSSEVFEFPPRGWTLRWYEKFFTSEEWRLSLITTLQVAVIAAPIATVLGVAAAIALDRAAFPGRAAIRGLMLSPLIVPGVLVAVAMFAVFLRWHLTGGMLGFVIVHVIAGIPFVVVTMTTRLAGYDRTVERAAATLGASSFTIFRRITLPLLAPGVLTGLVLAFVASVDEVVVALFIYTPEFQTLPVQMYRSIVFGIDPALAAASSILVVLTTVALLLLQFGPRGKEKV